jgi:predicted nucleotide-binding protein
LEVKISKEARDYIEAQFNIELNAAQSALDKQLQDILVKSYASGTNKSSITYDKNIQAKIEYIERLIRKKIQLYIKAYRRDGQIIDQVEHDEIVKELNALIEAHMSLVGTEYSNVFSGLNPQQSHSYEQRLRTGYLKAVETAKRELAVEMTRMRIEERDRIRDAILLSLFKKADGSEYLTFSIFELAKEEGVSELEARDYLDYMVERHLIKLRTDEGHVSITHTGIKKVENYYKTLGGKNRMPILLESDEDEHKPPQTPAEVKIFVVHGRNNEVKETVARFLEKLGLKPIILHEQPNKGRTIIEKFEGHSDVQFAVVLLTGDDRGGLKDQPYENQKLRARQNVILELGFFLGKLSRARVCAIYESGVEIPSDYQGVLFIGLNEDWKTALVKEMKAAALPMNLEAYFS